MALQIKDQQIHAFRHVMDCGSVTLSAKRLMMTQPGVSRLLKQLEHQLGFALFKRIRGRLESTPEARLFYQEVQRAYIGLEHLKQTALHIKDKQLGFLKISAMPIFALCFLPEVISRFYQDHSDSQISLYSNRSAQVVDDVVSHRVDLGFALVHREDQRYSSKHYQIPFVCILPQGHALAQQSVITPGDLRGLPFVSFEQEDTYRQLIDGLFEQQQIERHLLLESSFSTSIAQMVLKGLGVSIIDPMTAAVFEPQGLMVRPFAPALNLDCSMLMSTESPLSLLCDTFIEIFEEAVKEITGV